MTDGTDMMERNKPGLREDMPLLAKKEGVWEGVYRYYDTKTGELIDEHKSRLICRIITKDGVDRYHQSNHYFWADGREELRDFPAWYENGRIWWDNELIKGWAADMQPDDYGRSSCLNWTRKDEPGIYLYEMIQVNDACDKRARTWQWFRDGECYQRTLIDEYFVTKDWQSWMDNSPPKG